MSTAAEERALSTRLVELVSATDWLMQALQAVRASLDVPWCIGAGAIRTCVWDHLHGYPKRVPEDVDVAFFEPATFAAEERRLAGKLAKLVPELQWDVVNQAHAHTLSVRTDACAFVSLEDAIAAWPETATTVGVYLDRVGSLSVLAPHGLADLFNLVVKISPRLRDRDVFEQRCRSKRWRQRWPRVQIVPLTAP